MESLKKELIKLLKENARYTNAQLANIVGATEEQVKLAIADLEESGVIVKYSAIVNTEAYSEKEVQALIEVKVVPQKLKGFDSYAEEIYNLPEVEGLYLISGGFDFAIFVSGKDLKDVAKFVAEKLSVIEGITSVQTHFILKKYKIEGQVTRPSEEGQRQILGA